MSVKLNWSVLISSTFLLCVWLKTDILHHFTFPGFKWWQWLMIHSNSPDKCPQCTNTNTSVFEVVKIIQRDVGSSSGSTTYELCSLGQVISSIWSSISSSLKLRMGASLVAQWLRICLPMQGTRVRALVWEDPICRGAAGPVSHDYWACASGACASQQERPRQWEARAPRWRVAPACRN